MIFYLNLHDLRVTNTIDIYNFFPVAILEECPEEGPRVWDDVLAAEGLVGVELLPDGRGEEGALVLEPVPRAAALLQRQAVPAAGDLNGGKWFGILQVG